MKPRPTAGTKVPSRLAGNRRGAGKGKGAARKQPTPGWKAHTTARRGWRNPRPPAVPATLDITLDEYFTAASLIGLLASQADEPNQKWCREWSAEMGDKMAADARKRRRRRRAA